MPDTNPKTLRSSRGFSLIELLIVLAIVAILTALAIPAMVSQRRLLRSTAVTREIMTQLRYARQLAMSQRQSITFQYDDATKQIKIINHNNNQSLVPACNLSRTAILVAAGYPNTACSTVVTTIPLTQGGLSAAEITYGIPAGSPPLPSGRPGDTRHQTGRQYPDDTSNTCGRWWKTKHYISGGRVSHRCGRNSTGPRHVLLQQRSRPGYGIGNLRGGSLRQSKSMEVHPKWKSLCRVVVPRHDRQSSSASAESGFSLH